MIKKKYKMEKIKGKLLLSLFFLLLMAPIKAEHKFITHVTLTTYNAVKSQCDEQPEITANGTKICYKKLRQGKLKYCAVSRNLLCYLPYGSIIDIEGYGRYKVVDTMNARFSHHIDILQHHTKKNFKKERIKIVLVKSGNSR